MLIIAYPAETLYDEPISIRLEGFPPATQLTVRASSIDDAQHRWDSWAEFVTHADGGVDLARTAPKSGSYRTADAAGLLWSMTLDPAVKERTPFIKTTPSAAKIKLEVELKGEIVARAELTRSLMARGVVQTDVTDDGLVAKMFLHEDGARPGVILVGGSGGGLSIDHPALLASRGYAVMSLGYFGMPNLPADLTKIPLEYFGKAIAWMSRHPGVTPGGLAVIGASRGGELVLLLGATFPQISAVVAYVPSGVVWPGLGEGEAGIKSAWTWRGEHMPSVAPVSQGLEVWQKRPVAMTPWFLECLKNRESVERAAIAVEKIGGPVLIFSGTDDQMWPSLNLADIAIQRLIANNFAHPHEHVAYAGAGHFIRFPHTPVISEIFHPVAKAPMALGGTPEANQFANVDSWRRCLQFLSMHLK